METSVIASAITGLIHSLGVDVTDLKPPPPEFIPASFTSYISELNLTDRELAVIPSETIKLWSDRIFYARPIHRKIITEGSHAAQLINHLSKYAIDYECKKRDSLQQLYYEQTDEVDRVALSQIKSVFYWGWSYIAPFLSRKLVEGAFIGHVNQENYNRATNFSFQRMMHHTVRINAFRGLAFHNQTLHFVSDKLSKIQETNQEQSQKQSLWRYRWMTSEKMRTLEVILTFQRQFYEHLISNYPNENSIEIQYSIILWYSKINRILTELKASYFNHMLEIKLKSKLEANCQTAVNIVTQFLARTQERPPPAPREFIAVYKDALDLTWQAYNQKMSYKTEIRDLPSAIKDFADAISQDNFILAKFISLSTRAPEANFDWRQEAEKFEQYKRAIDRFLHIQDHLDDLISRLFQICNLLFESYIKAPTTMTTNYRKLESYIYELWEFRNNIDELRVAYRTAYLKSLTTSVNVSDKKYLDRIKQSIANKATRSILRGEIFDQTESQESAVDRGRSLVHAYREKLSEIKGANSDFSCPPIPEDLLEPIDFGEALYPVFYTINGYKEMVNNKDSFDIQTIEYIYYNIKRNCDLFPDPFWKAQLNELEKYSDIEQNLALLSQISEKYLRLAPSLEEILSEIKTKADNIRANLPKNLQKQLISDCNKEQPLNLDRVASSSTHKLIRFASSGQIFDQRKEFREIYDQLVVVIDTDARQLSQLIDFQNQPLTAHQIGNVYVFEPKLPL